MSQLGVRFGRKPVNVDLSIICCTVPCLSQTKLSMAAQDLSGQSRTVACQSNMKPSALLENRRGFWSHLEATNITSSCKQIGKQYEKVYLEQVLFREAWDVVNEMWLCHCVCVSLQTYQCCMVNVLSRCFAGPCATSLMSLDECPCSAAVGILETALCITLYICNFTSQGTSHTTM